MRVLTSLGQWEQDIDDIIYIVSIITALVFVLFSNRRDRKKEKE